MYNLFITFIYPIYELNDKMYNLCNRYSSYNVFINLTTKCTINIITDIYPIDQLNDKMYNIYLLVT